MSLGSILISSIFTEFILLFLAWGFIGNVANFV